MYSKRNVNVHVVTVCERKNERNAVQQNKESTKDVRIEIDNKNR